METTTPACWRALFAEKKLKHIDGDIIHLNKDDRQVDQDGDIRTFSFDPPHYWKIYEPPKWEDNIPEGGVMCRNINGDLVSITTDPFDRHDIALISSTGELYGPKDLTPCTKAEIQVWKDNAPE